MSCLLSIGKSCRHEKWRGDLAMDAGTALGVVEFGLFLDGALFYS
jgi:hypothetical protein